MADLEETDEPGSECPTTELESYHTISEPFSCSDEVNGFIIENVVETFSSSDVTEANFIDSHQLIVDSVLEPGSHLVASSDGQLYRLYKDGGDLTMTSTTTTVNGQPAIILRGLPYSQELLQTVKTEGDDCGPSRMPSKRLRVESDADKGYDVILSVSAASSNGKYVTDLKRGDAAAGSQNLIDEDSNESAASKVEESLTNPSDVSQNWFTTKDDKLALQSKGHQWKQGQWTKQEVDTLRQNIAQYCEERGIENPADVIFNMTKDERKNFYRTIAKGLQRPLFSVYRRVIRMYDRKNYIGKYSPEELARLKELRKKHGSDWATIGNILGRSASSVKDRCRLMKDTCNTGKWYPEEEKRLADVVYQLSGAKPGESVTSGLSWAQVAEHVNSRSEKQCRTKWLNYLNWKVKGGAEWTRDDDLLLLERLSEVQAKEEVDINWMTIAADWPSARSPQWLHGKWWSMKRHISNYSQMPFPQLLQMVKSMHTRNKTRSPTVSSFSSCLSSALQPSNSIKLEHLDFQTLQVMPGGKLAIPVTMSIDSASLSAEVCDDEESRTGSSVQSYRFLEDVCEQTEQETYVIARDSETNPSPTVFTMNGILADSLVIHTLKQGNKNVLVQMNPGINQVIIARDIHDDSDDSAHVLSSHHQVFHQLDDVGHDTDKLGHHRILHVEELEHEEVMNSMSVVINGNDLDVGEHISCDDEMVIANNFCEVIESEIHEQIDVGHSLESELVSLAGPHFVRMESNDGGNVLSSFADPMLMTDSSDLLSSMSDGDGDKSQEAIDVIDQSSDH